MKKSFLTLLDYNKKEVEAFIQLAIKLKADKKNNKEEKILLNKTFAIIFEKTSTRTRCSFEVAAFDQGANITYIGPSSSQISAKESIEDTAKVLGRYYDGIGYRGYGQKVVEDLAKYSNVPVWNGLTTEFHPTQILADFMTILEYKGTLDNITLAFVGDGNNNVAHSLLIGAALFGMDMRIVAPKENFPSNEFIEKVNKIAKESGAKITCTESVEEGITNCDVIYTDVWVSMGEEKSVWKERINKLLPYQVNSELVKYAKSDYLFMHCLPAFHDLETTVAKQIYEEYGITEMEVSDEIFRSSHSVVFDEAENRMHTIKAVMVSSFK